jgi:phosphate transport system substrate-binding protein
MLCLLLTSALGHGACARTQGERLTLAGSTSVQPVAEKWAVAYERQRSGLSLTVQGGGSTAGVRAALSGAAEVGLSSRSLTRQEEGRLRAVVVARDGIALVVHPRSPLRSLSLRQGGADLRRAYQELARGRRG